MPCWSRSACWHLHHSFDSGASESTLLRYRRSPPTVSPAQCPGTLVGSKASPLDLQLPVCALQLVAERRGRAIRDKQQRLRAQASAQAAW